MFSVTGNSIQNYIKTTISICSQVMAIVGDNEHLRHVDRIRAIAFREARDAGASFITRAWVAARLKRSERFVSDNWNKDPYETAMDKANIGLGGKQLSLQSPEIVLFSDVSWDPTLVESKLSWRPRDSTRTIKCDVLYSELNVLLID